MKTINHHWHANDKGEKQPEPCYVEAIGDEQRNGMHYLYEIGLNKNGFAQNYSTIKFDRPLQEWQEKGSQQWLSVPGEPGITDAALLAVLIDRLEGYQNPKSKVACEEYKETLSYLNSAMEWLLKKEAQKRSDQG